jgi:hypothetical protein
MLTSPSISTPTTLEENMSSDGDCLKNFTLFLKLPIELRLKIWRSFLDLMSFNLNFVYLNRDSTSFADPEMFEKTLKLETSASLSTTPYANRESRAETLKHYTIVFPKELEGFLLRNGWGKGRILRPICFDTIRTIFISISASSTRTGCTSTTGFPN